MATTATINQTRTWSGMERLGAAPWSMATAKAHGHLKDAELPLLKYWNLIL
jgi:hypothetical protein